MSAKIIYFIKINLVLEKNHSTSHTITIVAERKLIVTFFGLFVFILLQFETLDRSNYSMKLHLPPIKHSHLNYIIYFFCPPDNFMYFNQVICC